MRELAKGTAEELSISVTQHFDELAADKYGDEYRIIMLQHNHDSHMLLHLRRADFHVLRAAIIGTPIPDSLDLAYKRAGTQYRAAPISIMFEVYDGNGIEDTDEFYIAVSLGYDGGYCYEQGHCRAKVGCWEYSYAEWLKLQAVMAATVGEIGF